MDCTVCGFIDDELDVIMLEGGYVAKICDNCFNRYRSDVYQNFPIEKQVKFQYLHKLEELTEKQAGEYVQLVHEYFFFTKKWVEGKGDSPDDESELVRLQEMWTGKNGDD